MPEFVKIVARTTRGEEEVGEAGIDVGAAHWTPDV
jgi:hypothetical protein